MPAPSKIRNCRMKEGDHVIWLYSKRRSFVVGCGVQRVPALVIRVCRRRIRLRVLLLGSERLVNVDPDNVICEEDG